MAGSKRMLRPIAARKKRATMIPAIILSANHGHCTNLDSKSVFNFSDLSDNGIHSTCTTNKRSLCNWPVSVILTERDDGPYNWSWLQKLCSFSAFKVMKI